MSLRPVILAGGSGTRLWPLSRELYPKQFLPLAGERSMLQESLDRLDGLPEVTSPVVVCNEEHRFLVTEQARELGKPLSSIILEPAGRNTAPALTLAALQLIGQLAGQSDGADAADPVMLVMPADHVIKDVATFQAVVTTGAALAKGGGLVTFGIVPTAPKTGYGYIKKGPGLAVPGVDPTSDDADAFRVGAFVEKPDGPTAERLWASEEYLWNSGIFMMRASVWLGQVERYRPDIADACREAHAGGHWDGSFYRPDPDLFAACPADSIDYAVMEKAAGASRSSSKRRDGPAVPAPECVVIPLDAGWSDLGAWSEVWEKGDRDEDGNVTQGDVLTESIRNSLLIGRHRLLAAVGLDDLVVVETADAVLVAHKDRVQDVRSLVAQLKEQGRPEQANHRKVHRPWGAYETLDGGSRFQVKRLTVNPGAALSLQMHSHRAEHWVVVKGTAKVTRGDESFFLQENESTYVPVGTKHRLENQGPDPLEIIEVQSGSYLEEDDIVRFEDRYNRHDEGDARPRV